MRNLAMSPFFPLRDITFLYPLTSIIDEVTLNSVNLIAMCDYKASRVIWFGLVGQDCVRASSRLVKNHLTQLTPLPLLDTMARTVFLENPRQTDDVTGENDAFRLTDDSEMDPDDSGRHQLELDLGGFHALTILKEYEGYRVLLVVISDFATVPELEEWLLAHGPFGDSLATETKKLIDLRLGQAQREPSAPSLRSTGMPEGSANPASEPSGSGIGGTSSLLASVTIAVQRVLDNVR
jgi:hypothetical protein